MKNRKKKMLIIAGILLIAAGAAILCAALISGRNNVMDGDGMTYETDIVSFSYSTGGGMNGASYSVSLRDGSFTISECRGNGYKKTEKTYDCGADLYWQLDDIVSRYKIKNWTNLKKQTVFATDAPSSSLRFVFKDGLVISAGSTDKWPKGSADAIEEIKALFEEYR